RVTLAAVRLFNGGASLVAPRMFAQRLGRESDADGAAVHALRMFGIRTVLIALDLLSRDQAVRRHALRFSVLIHATDTVSAAMAGLNGQLPPKAARLATGVSAANVVLALLASREVRKG
ncbi:MAG TPA: hypothetical protein VFT76_04120, partial [Actinomycetota bacterium]|nr:hypothetical protein [Actinomycetota bacterium]